MGCTSSVTPIPRDLFLCGLKYSLFWNTQIISVQTLPYAVLDIEKHLSKSQCRTISLGSLLKAVVLRDARRDSSVGILVLIYAILYLCTMQFVALNATQEQRKVASISVRDLAEIYASQNAKSYYSTSLYHMDISLGS